MPDPVGGAGGAAGAGQLPPLVGILAANANNDFDIETAVIALAINRSETLQSVVEGSVVDMQAKNDVVKSINNAIQDLRAISDKDPNKVDFTGSNQPSAATEATLKALKTTGGATFWDTYVESYDGKYHWREEGDYTKCMDALKTAVDTNSSTNQLDMIKLQGLINKNNQMSELASNIMTKFANNADKIIGNIR